MENNQKVKKKFYKRWWFWAIIIFIILILITPKNENKEEATKQVKQTTREQDHQQNQPSQELVELKIIDYAVLRKWNPDDDSKAIGMEILISEDDASKENIINLIKSIGSKSEKVLVKVYQNKEAWEQEKSGDYGKEYNRGYLVYYVKNLTDSGAYRGIDEIRWFQEKGQLEELMGTKTKIK